MADIDINDLKWIEFDDNGLKILSKAEIMKQLEEVDKSSFGMDYIPTTTNISGDFLGTSWYTHNELIAQALASMGSAIKRIYDSSNILSATGRDLDNRVIAAGITRIDYGNGKKEIDGHLRARYMKAVSTPSISTRGGLINRLLNQSFVSGDKNKPILTITDVNIAENDGKDAAVINVAHLDTTTFPDNKVPGHSIVVAMYIPGITVKSELDGYTAVDTSFGNYLAAARYIATIIRNYKTLGCGTAGKESVALSTETKIYFTIIQPTSIDIDITIDAIDSTNQQVVDNLIQTIQQSVIDYIESFTIDKDVLYDDILSIAQNKIIQLGYNNNEVVVKNIKISDRTLSTEEKGGKIEIKADQIATVGNISAHRPKPEVE